MREQLRTRSRPGTSRALFFQKTLDALLAHIAILDGDGTIIAVNAAWNHFARANGLDPSQWGPGANYLRVCELATGLRTEDAVVALGIRELLDQKLSDFSLEYPCHSPTTQRWFHVRATRLDIDGRARVVVYHDDITERKLAEIGLQKSNELLELLATTDPLTRIANRRSFDDHLEREWRRHERALAPLSVGSSTWTASRSSTTARAILRVMIACE